jgi:peptidoglycan hydrolase CwlO-like protein
LEAKIDNTKKDLEAKIEGLDAKVGGLDAKIDNT